VADGDGMTRPAGKCAYAPGKKTTVITAQAREIIARGNLRLSDQVKRGINEGVIMDGARIISYNLNEDERPGGMKIRIKIRVESGRKGRARDARQAEGLKEYLTWVVQQEQQDAAGRP
jgi:hypothetical protein